MMRVPSTQASAQGLTWILSVGWRMGGWRMGGWRMHGRRISGQRMGGRRVCGWRMHGCEKSGNCVSAVSWASSERRMCRKADLHNTVEAALMFWCVSF